MQRYIFKEIQQTNVVIVIVKIPGVYMDVRKQREWIDKIINIQEESERPKSSKNGGLKEYEIQDSLITFTLLPNLLYLLITFS